MKTPFSFPLMLAVLSLTWGLTGCGGGGESSTTSPSVPKTPVLMSQQTLATAVNQAQHYLLYLPPGYADDPNKKWPLIVYLHGGGTDLDITATSMSYEGVPQFLSLGQNLPAIVVAPQQDRNFYGHKLAWHDVFFDDAVIKEVESKYRVDSSRISLTGFSLGGFGSWQVALAHPQRFAAVMVVAGAISNDSASYDQHSPITSDADWGHAMAPLAGTPIRVFHGTADAQVPYAWGNNPVNLLKNQNVLVDFRSLSGLGHVDAMNQAYTSENLQWLISQTRPQAQAAPASLSLPSEYAGQYTMDGEAVEVTAESDRIVLHFASSHPALPFRYISDDRFMALWMMRAQRDSQGQVKCLVTPLKLLAALKKVGASEDCN